MAPIDIGKHAGILVVNIEEQMIEALPRWRAFALSKAASVDDADDLVSRAIERIMERHRASPLPPDTNIEAFGITVIRNLMIDDARSRQTQKTDNVGDVEDVGGPSAGSPELSTYTQEVLRLIGQLCEVCREILTLCGVGATNTEIAEDLGININTVGTKKKRCREKLNDLMESDTLYDWHGPGVLE